MAHTSALARTPDKRRGRPARQPQKFAHISTEANSTFQQQLQFLTARAGISTARAAVLAALIWGMRHG